MRYTLVIAVMFLLVSVVQAAVPGKFYEVVKGDWLSKISLREYGTINAWKTLVKWNRQIPDGNRIYYGEKIFIPHRSVLGAAGQHVTQHTMKAGPGDTYKSISARIFGLDKRWRAIAKWNGHKGLYQGASVKFFGARPGIAMAGVSQEDEHMQGGEASEVEESEELSVGAGEGEEALAEGESEIKEGDTEAIETGSLETDEAARTDTPLNEGTDASDDRVENRDPSKVEESKGFSTPGEATGIKAKNDFIWLSIAFIFGLIIIVGIFLYLRKRRQNEQLGLSPGEESLPLDETGDRPVFFEEVRADEQTDGTEIEEMPVEELAEEEDTEVHNETYVEAVAEEPLATLELDKKEVINGSTPGEEPSLEEFAPQFEIIDETEEKPLDDIEYEEVAVESVEHTGEEIATINDTGVILNDSVLLREDTQLEEEDQLPEENPESVEEGALQESEVVLETETVEEAEEILPEEPFSEEDEPIVGMEVGAAEELNREILEGVVAEEGLVESIDVQMNAIDGQIEEIEEEYEGVVEPDIADSDLPGEESQVGEVNEEIGENIRDSVIPLGEAIYGEEDQDELEAPTIIEKDEDLVTEAMDEDVEKPGNISNEDEDLNEKIAEAVLEGDVTGDYNRYASEQEEVPAGLLGEKTLGESIATEGELLIAEAALQGETESVTQMKTQEQAQPKFEPADEAGQEEGYTDAVEAGEDEEEHHDFAIPARGVASYGEVPEESVPHDSVPVREPISFKKSDMVQLVMEKFDLSYIAAQEAVNEIFEIMTGGLKEDGNVRLRELFHMSIKKNRRYKGRNPRTGEEIVVPSKKVIHFKMGKELFELVNEHE